MRQLLAFLIGWLTPGRRKAIYAALAAFGVILVLLGVTTDSMVTGVVGLVDAVLGVLALALASYKARKVNWTAVYGVMAVLAGAMKTLGIVTDGQASHALDVIAAATIAAPLLIAAFRTSTDTPTGEPVEEYRERLKLVRASDVVIQDEPYPPRG